jgi:hypothetical protein
MLFVNLATGMPKTKVQIINENKNISLPRVWTEDTLELLGVANVEKTQPEVSKYELAIRDGIEEIDGVWKEKWIVQSKFIEYTDENGILHTIAEQENAAASEEVRSIRNILLKETDWTALSDVTMSAEMAAYRQALRDITTQDGFPHEVTWPVKP